MREQAISIAAAAGSAALLCVLALLLLGGGGTPPAPAVRVIGGVPVGVEDSPAGALAAADNYVALASQWIEQNPGVFAALVAQAFTASSRGGVLAQARAIRRVDVANMKSYEEGGRAVAILAARRLDSYTPTSARVTSWLGGIVWGPRLSPRQTWNLIETTLRWQAGRWRVVSMDTSTTPAPVPAVVYVNGGNDQAAAFARLDGMSAPFYGRAE
jgi:hypothetical protein